MRDAILPTRWGRWFGLWGICLLGLLVGGAAVDAAVVKATPSDFRTKLTTLKPGDTLELAAGTYTRSLHIQGLNGRANAWITITGPTSGAPAVFVAQSCCNTVELVNASYIAIRHLTLDGKGTSAAFGISAKNSSNNRVHHIRIERCTIQDYNGSQQIVGISTKTPTWGWEIRHNKILRPGTGMYLGNSNGAEAFVGGIIEHNLIQHPTGYCMQIKHQFKRDAVSGMPTQPAKTIIRHNVFIKDNRPSPSGDRPNVLVGGHPESGNGSQDVTEVYGNLFFHNPRESLLQATGRVAIYDNIFADVTGTAITLRTHNVSLRRAHVFHNTIYAATNRGIYVGTRPADGLKIVGNLIFAGQKIGGSVSSGDLQGNLDLTIADAANSVVKPSKTLGQIDLFPLPGKCTGSPLSMSVFSGYTDYDKDFNGRLRSGFRFRGAYGAEGSNPGWRLQAAIKRLSSNPPSEPPPPDAPAPETSAEPKAPDAGPEPITPDSPAKEPVTPDAPAPEPSVEPASPDTPRPPDGMPEQGAQEPTNKPDSPVAEIPTPELSGAEPSTGIESLPDASGQESAPSETGPSWKASGCGCQMAGSTPVGGFGLLALIALLCAIGREKKEGRWIG